LPDTSQLSQPTPDEAKDRLPSELRNNREERLDTAGNGFDGAAEEMLLAGELAMSKNNGNGTNLLARGRIEMPVLSEQQRTFVTAYLKKGNASEAARLAGFNWPGQKGAKLLKTAKIRAAINAELKPDPFTGAHVFAALSELAYANLGQILDEDGQPDVEKIRAHGGFVRRYKARVIRSRSTDQVTVTNVQIELYDRMKALVTIGRMLGMFSETARVTRVVNQFFDSLDEALVMFVPPENRVAMVAFFRERLGHHAKWY
jgi:hypothetical protein